MRVAFDITIPARAITGVGVYARQLLAALQPCSFDLRLWQRWLAPSGGRFRRVMNGARLVAWHQIEIPRRVRRDGVDVYHSACSIGPVGGFCPVVMTVHDASLLTMPTMYGQADLLYHRLFSVTAAQRAAAVLVPTEAARSAIAEAYRIPPSRLHVVPYGVAPDFHPASEADCAPALRRYGISGPFVLSVGAEPPRKNLPRLVQAFAEAVAETGDRETSLIFAGPSEPRDRRVDAVIARLQLEARVRRVGAVSSTELAALYNGATCLAYPSLCEGFGFPILEAMACGTSVLTSDRTSTAEVAGNAAVLVDPESTASIAAGLVSLLTDRARRDDLRGRGFERSAAYTWERTARLTEAVYRSVAHVPIAIGVAASCRPDPPGIP